MRVNQVPDAGRAATRRPPRAHRVPRLPSAAANGLLPADAARDLLARAGVPVIDTIRCDSPAAAVAAAGRLGYPAVVKVDHPDLTHKSDVGGVRLSLASSAEVGEAAAEILTLADGAAVLVQHQHEGVELLVGGLRDPAFGPVVTVGLGGVLAETWHDVQLAVAPVTVAEAAVMLRALRGAAIFDGLRGGPAVDIAPVADMIVRIGDLITDHPEIAELDLNPVLVTAARCLAVDWRIRVG
jgi:acetyltransferase